MSGAQRRLEVGRLIMSGAQRRLKAVTTDAAAGPPASRNMSHCASTQCAACRVWHGGGAAATLSARLPACQLPSREHPHIVLPAGPEGEPAQPQRPSRRRAEAEVTSATASSRQTGPEASPAAKEDTATSGQPCAGAQASGSHGESSPAAEGGSQGVHGLSLQPLKSSGLQLCSPPPCLKGGGSCSWPMHSLTSCQPAASTCWHVGPLSSPARRRGGTAAECVKQCSHPSCAPAGCRLGIGRMARA